MNRRGRTFTVTTAIGSILVVIGMASGLLRPLENVLALALRPVGAPLFSGSNFLSRYVRELNDRDELTRENESLREEVGVLAEQSARYKATIADLNVLREELAFIEDKGFTATVARVVARSSDGVRSMITVNRGVEDGVAVGNAVIAAQGSLVGKVVEVHGRTANVLLLVDSNFETTAVIDNEPRTPGLVVGNLGLTVALELIPFNEEAEPTQLVVTAGSDGTIPANLPIGIVTGVKTEPGELFKTATLEPIVDVRDVAIVSVLTGAEEE